MSIDVLMEGQAAQRFQNELIIGVTGAGIDPCMLSNLPT